MMDKRSKQEHRLTFQNLDLAQELLHMCGQLGLRSVQRAARGERATSTFEHTLLLLLNTKKMMFSANTLDMQVELSRRDLSMFTMPNQCTWRASCERCLGQRKMVYCSSHSEQTSQKTFMSKACE